MVESAVPDGASPLASPPLAVVAGCICLDIIPTINTAPGQAGYLVVPGKRTRIGPAQISTGGAVSNTGLALHRLGINTRLMAKVGADRFGEIILDILRQRDPALAEGMILDSTAPTSYTIVISAPNLDRSFLHCEGVNDNFSPADVDVAALQGASLFHFGYPPTMRRIYEGGGEEFARLFAHIKRAGIATSLDTSHVDANSTAGWVDWRGFLARVASHLDFFLPSLDEVLYMIDPDRHQAIMAAGRGQNSAVVGGISLLRDLATPLLEMGVAVVGIKLGDQGFYLRTTSDAARLQSVGQLALSPEWLDREIIAPAFQVNVVGTTGAGDCAVAGFLASVLRGRGPEATLTTAVAAGACNVEVVDATSGIPTWEKLQTRINQGWPRRSLDFALDGWLHDPTAGLWHSPTDHIARQP